MAPGWRLAEHRVPSSSVSGLKIARSGRVRPPEALDRRAVLCLARTQPQAPKEFAASAISLIYAAPATMRQASRLLRISSESDPNEAQCVVQCRPDGKPKILLWVLQIGMHADRQRQRAPECAYHRPVALSLTAFFC